MEKFFNMDNRFFSFMGRVADLMILNILCLVCCIPIITAGASITAMFYVTLKMVRNEESYIVRGFFKSFKENFKQATAINLIMLVTALLIYFDINVARSMGGTSGNVLFTLFIVILIIYVMIYIYIYPLLAKFYNTVKNTFINAFLMSIRHLPYTLLMAVISVLPLGTFFIGNTSVISMIMLFLVLMGASTIAYINSLFFVKIFDKYIPKEDEEAEKKDGEDRAPAVPDETESAVGLPESGEAENANPSVKVPEPGDSDAAKPAPEVSVPGASDDMPQEDASADMPQEDASADTLSENASL